MTLTEQAQDLRASAAPAPATGGLRLGRLSVASPFVLAPMAGITNAAYRRLCREQADAAFAELAPDVPGPHGLFVCEMVTSRGIVERDAKSLAMLAFDPGERTRSVQLYGVEPGVMAEATRIVCGEFGVHHVDLNFGCPVPKVTRKGGGAALPYKRNLMGAILRSVVGAAEPFGTTVTMKTRMGIDEQNLTFRDAGRIAADAGVAAIALHARTAAQHYSGQAHWDAIAELVAATPIPVLGNGDIWQATDAIRLRDQTGCAGVVVGRGCLGRPWLFGDLARVFAARHGRAGAGSAAPALPRLGEVARLMRRHAELLVELMGELRGMRDFRKHVSWYLKGFPVGGHVRHAGGLVGSLDELDEVLAGLDPTLPYPVEELGAPRGRQGSPRKVVLPAGWLDDTDGVGLDLAEAEDGTSGG